jgi:hypothetical protein
MFFDLNFVRNQLELILKKSDPPTIGSYCVPFYQLEH